jgi:hypothetical protein
MRSLTTFGTVLTVAILFGLGCSQSQAAEKKAKTNSRAAKKASKKNNAKNDSKVTDSSVAKKATAKKPTAESVSKVSHAKIKKLSSKVDRLIDAQLKKNKIERNAEVSDELFMRRIYLDIVGRIPTYDEAKSFLDSDATNKRTELIDRLLDSDGYVSHQFNYFADLLRIQSRMRYGNASDYITFVKDALQQNRPYDQFVRELVTAQGYTWDNGAAGYYLRDSGMPLDNMSNTVQVFLGTQLVCAQCHNHPFDSWTQKQYYQLAAFSYGVNTRDRTIPQALALRKMRRDGDVDRMTVQAAGQVLQQLNYRVNETERPLRLPKDYQYDDAKPLETIDPKTIFGDEVVIKEGDSNSEIYARWMTSPTNPRFATVISNRLWKRVMGIGVIEPVDDIKDDIEPTNPELMAFLSEQMVDLKFDLKQYMRVLFNTRTYQSEVSVDEVLADDTYYFPGPVLRRASAEQLWDSLLTMTIVDLDERRGVSRYNPRYGNGKELVAMEMKDVLKKAAVLAKQRSAQYEYSQRTREMQNDLRVAYRTQDRDKISVLREKMAKIRKEVYGPDFERASQKERQRQRERYTETDPRWKGVSRELVRASETDSPARAGHFLRQFGQSDRETIENANTEATVPQILTMLNGPMFFQLANARSLLAKNLEQAETREEKLDVIFLSILSRRATERERELALDKVDKQNSRDATGLMWALLNTRQFMFIQ